MLSDNLVEDVSAKKSLVQSNEPPAVAVSGILVPISYSVFSHKIDRQPVDQPVQQIAGQGGAHAKSLM